MRSPTQYSAWKNNDQVKTVIEPPYPYMTDVPEGQQGTAVRAIRGKTLHDKTVNDKLSATGQLGPIPRGAFVHGAKKDGQVFYRYPYVGDNYENKRDKRREDNAENKADIHSGAMHVKTNIHEPFQPDMYLYNHQNKLPEFKDRFTGTRFSKTRSTQEPWRPNNPAKKGHNMTMNKQHYYHQTLYYNPKDKPKVHEENLWIPNYKGTLEKPQRDSQRFFRNGRVRHTSVGLLPHHPTRKQLLG